jgi:predicted lactoylglutathione lyase
MSTKIFVNLTVRDLDRSVKFFRNLGFNFNVYMDPRRAQQD